MKTKDFLAFLLSGSLLFATIFSLPAQDAPENPVPLPTAVLHIGKVAIDAEIANTPASRERGLMFRQKMADNDGMLFLMPGISTATFWMKNTLIPLSVAFLDHNGVILEIHDMKPLDETITRSDSDQVAYALEMNLHWFALNGIKPGDKITPAPATFSQTPAP